MAIAAEDIRSVIAAETGIEPAALDPEATIADLDINSLDLASVAFELEDRFGVEIEPENISRDFTLTQLIGYVQSLEKS